MSAALKAEVKIDGSGTLLTGSSEVIKALRHDQLAASPLNPRKHARGAAEIDELANSIAEKGVLQNLVVRPAKEPRKFEIVAGEGRWRAVGRLIETKRATAAYLMPALVREIGDVELIEIALVENVQRNDLHPLDEAKAFLDLYERRTGSKAAAKGDRRAEASKAAGDVVKALAQKIGRSDRYVQKRLALARNLNADATQLLEQGTINLAVAQTLAVRPEGEQKKILDNFRHWNTKEFDADRLKHATAGDVARDLIRKWRPMAHALFQPYEYKGPIEEIDGVFFAVDAKQFDELQQMVVTVMVRQLKKQEKAGAIAFFESGRHFQPHKYERKTDAKGEPDAKGGVFLEKDEDGAFHVHKGLFKTKHAIAQEKADARYRSESAKAVAKSRAQADKPPPPDDPRPAQVVAFVAKSPATLMAIDLANMVGDWAAQVHWVGGDDHWNIDVDAAREVLKKLRRGALPKGPDLLKWLLKQKLSDLAPAWSALTAGSPEEAARPIPKPSKAELILFDHCGAKLPPAKPDSKAAAKTAKKSKPSAKKGRKK